MKPSMIVIYCGLLATVTAFSVDITLPAFRLIADDLQADYYLVQLIVPLFILAAGIGQIFAGPFSDRLGRRPVIMAGLTLYALGAFICYLANTIEMVLAGRLLQGFGAAAGVVVGRSIIRDLFSGRELASNMALATMIFAFGPIVAPLLGVSIMSLGSWRLVFLVIMAFGIALVAFALTKLPETNRAPNRDATKFPVIVQNTKSVFKNRQSRFFVLLVGPISAMMMTILVSVPRIYETEFGITGTLFAILFALHGLGIIAGQLVNRQAIKTIGPFQSMQFGAAQLVATVLLMAVLDYFGLLNAYVLTGTLILFATGYLVVVANANSLAMDPHGDIAGFVSSLLGLFAQFFGASIAIATALFIEGNPSMFIAVLLVLSVAILTAISLNGES